VPHCFYLNFSRLFVSIYNATPFREPFLHLYEWVTLSLSITSPLQVCINQWGTWYWSSSSAACLQVGWLSLLGNRPQVTWKVRLKKGFVSCHEDYLTLRLIIVKWHLVMLRVPSIISLPSKVLGNNERSSRRILYGPASYNLIQWQDLTLTCKDIMMRLYDRQRNKDPTSLLPNGYRGLLHQR
jgi:hypothetical protein